MKGNDRLTDQAGYTMEHKNTEENLQELYEELLLKALCSRVPMSFLLNEAEV